MKIKIIFLVAVSKDNVMGYQGKIPWYHKEDVQRFKSITTGHPIVMGRKTWESLPIKPLPDRDNIVLSHSFTKIKGCKVYKHLEDVIKDYYLNEKLYIIGGSEIFRNYMSYCDVIDITYINEEHQGDVWFPQIMRSEWLLINSNIKGVCDYRIYIRKNINESVAKIPIINVDEQIDRIIDDYFDQKRRK